MADETREAPRTRAELLGEERQNWAGPCRCGYAGEWNGDTCPSCGADPRDRGMAVRIIANERGNPTGKLADVELRFTSGPLAGLKLVGFAVWERRTGNGRNVTFPARTYSLNGERRSFALLRPTSEAGASDRVRDLVLAAYTEYENRDTAGIAAQIAAGA